jgi:hypothetical protein
LRLVAAGRSRTVLNFYPAFTERRIGLALLEGIKTLIVRGLVGLRVFEGVEVVKKRNASRRFGARRGCCPATQTRHRQDENHLQIPGGVRSRRPRAATFTRPLQNEESLSPLE